VGASFPSPASGGGGVMPPLFSLCSPPASASSLHLVVPQHQRSTMRGVTLSVCKLSVLYAHFGRKPRFVTFHHPPHPMCPILVSASLLSTLCAIPLSCRRVGPFLAVGEKGRPLLINCQAPPQLNFAENYEFRLISPIFHSLVVNRGCIFFFFFKWTK